MRQYGQRMPSAAVVVPPGPLVWRVHPVPGTDVRAHLWQQVAPEEHTPPDFVRMLTPCGLLAEVRGAAEMLEESGQFRCIQCLRAAARR